MFWGDTKIGDIKTELKETIQSGAPLVIRDEKTASGRIHVGALRGVAIHGIISDLLSEAGIANTFLYEINDFDPMDSLPSYLDPALYDQHMGKPLYMIPAPEGSSASNYPEHFGQEFMNVIGELGFYPEFYRARELYTSGRMNEPIRLALERADDIRRIYRERSGSEKPEGWLPISILCEQCGKIGTTTASDFDGETVAYTCKPDLVEWAVGCGHTGRISPFDGNAKFPWKVDWAAKFAVVGVAIEGEGKDLSTKGGARDVANHIAKEIFGVTPPFDIPYEFFLIEGKKMSTSKGGASTAREMMDLIPPEILRLALIGKNPMRAFNFDPKGDTIPNLFDLYDKLAEKYFGGENDDEARTFYLIHPPEDRATLSHHFRPRFSQIAFLVQMPHMDVAEEVAKIKGEPLTETEKQEVAYRAEYAQYWLAEYAPESFRYELQTETIPDAAQQLSDEQKTALTRVKAYIEEHETLNGQDLHTALHDIRKDIGIAPQEFFSAIYQSFLGKESGPKAGWFLSVLEREFLIARLQEVSA